MTSIRSVPSQGYPHMDSLFVQVLEALGDTGPAGRDWLTSVAQGIAALPWQGSHLPDGRRPLQPAPAAELLIVLLRHLHREAPAPTSINPTGDGRSHRPVAPARVRPRDILRARRPSGLPRPYEGPGVRGPCSRT